MSLRWARFLAGRPALVRRGWREEPTGHFRDEATEEIAPGTVLGRKREEEPAGRPAFT